MDVKVLATGVQDEVMIEGATGASFLRTLAALLQDPLRILA